jgi:hypothetical protein
VKVLIQKSGDIEIAGRMTVAGQQRGGFTAVLCAMIDDMNQTMP